VVVPPCPGLVAAPPPGPSQVEGEAGAGDEPGGVLPGEAVQAGSFGDGQPDGGALALAQLPNLADGQVELFRTCLRRREQPLTRARHRDITISRRCIHL
jgi:hypothetical protein